MNSMEPPQIIAFDIFGTVVDWYGSVYREVQTLDLGVEPGAFALAWREGYAPAMKKINDNPDTWVLLDDLHREILDRLLVEFNVQDLPESAVQNLNRVWHRLDPWPDSVEGLQRLKSKFTICTLSNGNIGLLTNMAKKAGLPWDCVLSAEVFRQYKPHPDTYLGVARVFDVEPDQVMLAAAHQNDLDAAREFGLQTAYIERPHEFGPDNAKDVSGHTSNNYHSVDIGDLASQLGC